MKYNDLQYRLIEADGRENNPSTPFPWWDDSYRSTDNSLTTAYTQHYEYDKLGNIQKLQHIGDTLFTRNFDYSNANNKLNSISVGINMYSYLYDSSGNQIQENSNRFFEWDFANNMRCFYNQASTAEPTIYAQYLYDSAGNRVKKIIRTQGGAFESITYIDGAFEYKTDGSDDQTLTHIMDDTSRIAMIRVGDDFGDTTPEIKYNLEDHLGSSSVLLEDDGTLINKEEYYPFGETSFGSYERKRYRYSGKEKDQESGLYYYGARYYMAMGCRFISTDPHSFNYENLSPYSYVANNPLLYIDPDGKDIEVGKKKTEQEKVAVPEPKTKLVLRDDLEEDVININDAKNYKEVVTNQDEIDKAVEYNREVDKHNAKIRKHNAEIDAKIALFKGLGFTFDYNQEEGTLENAKLNEGVQLEANSTANYMYRSINDSKTYKLKTNRIPAQQITSRIWGREDGSLLTPNAFAFRGKNSGAISKKALANPNKENLQKILAADLAEFVDGADSTQVAFRLFYGIESSHYKSKIGINRDGLKFDLWTKTTRGNVPNSIVKGDPKRNLVR